MVNAIRLRLSCACLALILVLVGCTSPDRSTPAQAVARAAAIPIGVETTVSLVVRDVRDDGGGFLLSSSADPLDAESVNIVFSPQTAAVLLKTASAPDLAQLRARYLDQAILARGIVRVSRIARHRTGEPTPETPPPALAYLFANDASQIVLAATGLKPRMAETLDSRNPKTEDFIRYTKGDRLMAAYIEPLQKRISRLYHAELFSAQVGEGFRLPPGIIRFEIMILPDGRLAAETEELKHQLKAYPELTVIVLRVLSRITDDPTPWPPELVARGSRMIRYEASFGIE